MVAWAYSPSTGRVRGAGRDRCISEDHWAARTVVQYIYHNAINRSDVGYASAIAVIMLVITLSVSLLLFKYMKQDEDQLS